MAGGGAEVPHDRLAALGQQAEAVELVRRPRADVGRRDVADVAPCRSTAARRAPTRQQRLDAREALLAQAVEAHALLPVDRHRAVAVQIPSSRRSPLQLHGRPQQSTDGSRLPDMTPALTLGGSAATLCKRLQRASDDRSDVKTWRPRMAQARLGWIGTGRMGFDLASACSRPATTSRSTTARGRRPSRWPSWARRRRLAGGPRRPRHRLHDGRRPQDFEDVTWARADSSRGPTSPRR